MKPEDIDDFVLWAALGIVLGGRLGYVLFYDLQRYMAQPADIVAIWQGGMSFHGGFLGTTLAMILFARGAAHSDLVAVRRHRRRRADRRSGSVRSPISSIRRAVGAGDRCALGRGLPQRRPAAAPSEPALRGGARRRRSVLSSLRDPDPRLPQAESARASSPAPSSSAMGWRASCRVLPRARPAARLSVRRLADHGHGAVEPDGAVRACGRC